MPGFVYPCTCPMGCVVGNTAQCEMDKVTRNSCKMCRYTKCKSAGMVMEWVLSAYIPRVEKQKCFTKKKVSNNCVEVVSTTDEPNNVKADLSIDEVIDKMKESFHQAFVIDPKVVNRISE